MKRKTKEQKRASAIVDLELIAHDCESCGYDARAEGRKGEARAWRATARQIRIASKRLK